MMLKIHKHVLFTVVFSICLLSSQATTYAQNVNVPREPTTRENDGPRQPSRALKAVQIILEVLSRVVCEEAGNCTQIPQAPADTERRGLREFDRGRTPVFIEPRYGSSSPPGFSFHTPQGWQAYNEQSSVTIAPPSEYVNSNLTNGVILGLADLNGKSFDSGSDKYVRGLMSGNKYLRRIGRPESNVFNSVSCITNRLAGVSPQTGYSENVVVYTCQRSAQKLLYVVNVNSGPNASRYEEENGRIIQSFNFR